MAISIITKPALESDLARIHASGSTNTTGAAIAAGTYFYLNGVLVRAIGSGIASGAAFTSDTNYEAVPDGGLNEALTRTGSSAYTGNFDDLPTGWVYAGSGATGKPNSHAFFVITMRRTSYAAQLAIDRTDGTCYSRSLNSSVWTSWSSLSNS